MCDLTPEILSAQVFAADGVTPVAGKGLLNRQRLLFELQRCAQLPARHHDADGRGNDRSESAADRPLPDPARRQHAEWRHAHQYCGCHPVVQWQQQRSQPQVLHRHFDQRYARHPGQSGRLHRDGGAVGICSSKRPSRISRAVSNPATTAVPGDKLRYTLRFRTTNQALNNFSIFDDMDALNAQADFAPGTLTLVTSPAGADISATSSTGGSKGTGVIDIRNLSLPVNSEALIQFDITLKSPIATGTVVTNQATLRLANGTTFAWSDDPNVNGTADPTVAGGEDPTRVTIVVGLRLPGAEDLHLSARSERPGRRRHDALHHHGEEHQQCRCRERHVARCGTGEHGLRCGQHDTEWRQSRGCRGRVAARERHADQLAGQCDGGFDACRRVGQPGHRRNHHLRCRRAPRPPPTARSSRTRAS